MNFGYDYQTMLDEQNYPMMLSRDVNIILLRLDIFFVIEVMHKNENCFWQCYLHFNYTYVSNVIIRM